MDYSWDIKIQLNRINDSLGCDVIQSGLLNVIDMQNENLLILESARTNHISVTIINEGVQIGIGGFFEVYDWSRKEVLSEESNFEQVLKMIFFSKIVVNNFEGRKVEFEFLSNDEIIGRRKIINGINLLRNKPTSRDLYTPLLG